MDKILMEIDGQNGKATAYDDRVVFSKQTKYQKLVITKNKADTYTV